MKILVITPPREILNEVETIHELFQGGLEILHLRKPDYDSSRLEALLQRIDSKYHCRIMLHSHHNLSLQYRIRGVHFPLSLRENADKQSHLNQSTSCHSLVEMEACEGHFEYCMVSPVFDSISKPGYYAGINTHALKRCIERSGRRVVGLGGITDETIRQLPGNCWGAAVLGYVWCHESIRKRMSSFEKLLAGAEKL